MSHYRTRHDLDRAAEGPCRSRRGMLLGVCRGFAEHFGISAFWLRLGAVAACILTGIWPVVILYVVAAFLMPLESRGW